MCDGTCIYLILHYFVCKIFCEENCCELTARTEGFWSLEGIKCTGLDAREIRVLSTLKIVVREIRVLNTLKIVV